MISLPQFELIELPDAVLHWYPEALDIDQARYWFERLLKEIQWREEQLHMFGRKVTAPRLLAWYGDPGAHYRYSGVDHQPLDWTPTLAPIRSWIQQISNSPFNAVLANRYRNGYDCMGWHSDDETELGKQPIVASLSLGASRVMRFRRRSDHRQTYRLELSPGSLLIMRGATQQYWQHCITRTRKPTAERINLTFRLVDKRPHYA